MNLQQAFVRLCFRFHNAQNPMSEPCPKSFFRPGKILLLLLLGILIYGAVLLVWVPAGWVWQQASRYAQLPPQVVVKQVSGQLWDGAAGLVIVGFPVRVNWHLGWPSLGKLQLPVGFSLSSSGSRIEGNAELTWPGSLKLKARGQIAVIEFEDLIRQSGGAMIEGMVSIDRLNLWTDDRLRQADGLGRWEGGQVTWPMASGTGQAEFPPMQAMLDTTDGGLALTVGEQGAGGPAADASILWNGMMELRVYKRMVDLARQPWPDSAQPGDVVFRVRQPLVPGGF